MWSERSCDTVKEYINVAAGLRRVRGSKALYCRMLRLFLDSKEPGALENALTEKEFIKAGEAAHAIKGMTGNLSLDKLSRISADLVNQFRQGVKDQATIDEYRRVLVQTRIYIEELLERPDELLG